jgi:RNA polymerase sigma-70 factor (ECF subfamily)
MAQLDQEDADILALVPSSDLSYKEISRISGISEANVKTKIHRTRLKLKKILSAGEL